MVDKGKNEDFYHVRSAARKAQKKLSFSSEKLPPAANNYVAWIDLMGAGHLMSTSVHKSANFLARLHMAVADSSSKIDFSGHILAINDGVFLVTESKEEIMVMVRDVMALLALYFVAVPRQRDRFFVRCGVAYGPVYFGGDLAGGITDKGITEACNTLDHVAFGPPIISAYRAETNAPPFGVAIHESARAFSPKGFEPFRMTHWLWWQNQEEMELAKGVSLPDLKDCLLFELQRQFQWLRDTLIFTELTSEKISAWEAASKQYFSLA